MVKRGLEPVVNSRIKVIILGSLPGDMSIEMGQYYAKPGNDFWKLMGAVLGKDLYSAGYPERKKELLGSRIGLWDVFHSAEREGSMDHNIRSERMNDLPSLKRKCPLLEAVYFNGKKAGEQLDVLKSLGYDCYVLPSSSGVNRSDQAGRLAEWKKIRKYIR